VYVCPGRDATLQTVVGKREGALASQPTLSRLENETLWESIRLFESEGTEWFCRHEARRGEGSSSLYAIGMPRNSKLQAHAEGLRERAEKRWQESSKPVRLYTSFYY